MPHDSNRSCWYWFNGTPRSMLRRKNLNNGSENRRRRIAWGNSPLWMVRTLGPGAAMARNDRMASFFRGLMSLTWKWWMPRCRMTARSPRSPLRCPTVAPAPAPLGLRSATVTCNPSQAANRSARRRTWMVTPPMGGGVAPWRNILLQSSFRFLSNAPYLCTQSVFFHEISVLYHFRVDTVSSVHPLGRGGRETG